MVAGFLIVLFGDWYGMGSYINIAYSYYEGGLYWVFVRAVHRNRPDGHGNVILFVRKLRDD
jgi:hypothetical protein